MTIPATTTLGALGERELLHHIQARVPAVAGVVVGIGDDAAAVEIGPFALVTTDSLVEGVHFLREATPPRLLGRKALSVNLSDIAATGGLARYATVSLCLPPQTELGVAGLAVRRAAGACRGGGGRARGRQRRASRRGDRRRRDPARRRRAPAAAQWRQSRETASSSRERSGRPRRACA